MATNQADPGPGDQALSPIPATNPNTFTYSYGGCPSSSAILRAWEDGPGSLANRPVSPDSIELGILRQAWEREQNELQPNAIVETPPDR